MKKSTKTIFIDMDGTIVEFRQDDSVYIKLSTALNDNLNFFNRPPLPENIEAIKHFINFYQLPPENVFILSLAPATNFENSKNVKIKLVKELFPEILEKNILIHKFNYETKGNDKVNIAEKVLGRKLTKHDVLIEDDITNAVVWEKEGGGKSFHVSSLYYFPRREFNVEVIKNKAQELLSKFNNNELQNIELKNGSRENFKKLEKYLKEENWPMVKDQLNFMEFDTPLPPAPQQNSAKKIV